MNAGIPVVSVFLLFTFFSVHSLPSSLISYTVPVLELTISVCTEGTDLGEVATGAYGLNVHYVH